MRGKNIFLINSDSVICKEQVNRKIRLPFSYNSIIFFNVKKDYLILIFSHYPAGYFFATESTEVTERRFFPLSSVAEKNVVFFACSIVRVVKKSSTVTILHHSYSVCCGAPGC